MSDMEWEADVAILPGTGRGTSEAGGGVPSVCLAAEVVLHCLLCPSTTLRVVPLPRWGRIGYVRYRSFVAI